MKSTIFLLALVTLLISCDKKDDEGSGPSAPASFTFSINGGATITADTKAMEFNSTTGRWMIRATKSTIGTTGYYSVELAPSNTGIGNYPVTAASPTPGSSYIFFYDSNDVGSFSSGSINISQKTETKISGTFTASGGDHPTVTSISGSFNNVPIY